MTVCYRFKVPLLVANLATTLAQAYRTDPRARFLFYRSVMTLTCLGEITPMTVPSILLASGHLDGIDEHARGFRPRPIETIRGMTRLRR